MRTTIPTRARAVATIAMVALAWSPLAHAEDIHPTAQRLFQEASKLLNTDPIRACKLFEDSLAYERMRETLMNVANCHQKVGRLASAWRLYREAEPLFHEAAAHAATRQQAATEEKLAAIAASMAAALVDRLPRIQLHVSAAPAGLTISSNGEVIPQSDWGKPMPVDPGTYKIRAEAPNYHSRDLSAEAREGETVRIDVELEPVPAPVLPPPPPPWWSRRVTIYSVGGVGVATLATGLTFGALAMSKIERAKQLGCNYDTTICPDKEAQEVSDRAGLFSKIATSTSIAGGTLVGVALVLYVLAPDERRAPVPYVNGEGAGMSWAISF